MVPLFWVSVGLVFYVYIGYAALLSLCARLAARLRARSDRREADHKRSRDGSVERLDETLPGLSIVIAARNEGFRLAARLNNLLSIDYPASKRQIIVVLDGSTDNSTDVLERYLDTVDVVAVPAGGKATALNAGVSIACNDILVFADARQQFATDALRELVSPFRDESIGGVTGELLLDAEAMLFANRRKKEDRRAGPRNVPDRRQGRASSISDGVGLYWRYEKALRRMESAVGSTLGATGAIYAIRRSLWRDLPPDTILDDVLVPMRVVMSGSRVVFNDRAVAFDRAAPDAEAELRRKVRTLSGNYQLLRLEPRLLSPSTNPVWLQFVSHKLGRLVVPYALLTMFASSLALSQRPFYLWMLSGQVGFYLLAACGAYLETKERAGSAHRPPRGVSACPSEREGVRSKEREGLAQPTDSRPASARARVA
jgi:cellulose synthase/poly-beta-1,6-N-acetylglucosamine synthase-like glycosyltransferase